MSNQERARRGQGTAPAELEPPHPKPPLAVPPKRGKAAAAAFGLALATAAGSLAAASPALAQGDRGRAVGPAATVPRSAGRLSRIKAEAARWVTARARSLDQAMAAVQSYSFLGSDGTTLVANMRADVSGLEALDQKIQSDTTVAQAVADAADIFTQFRVYYLVLPVVSYVVATDRVDNVYVPALNSDISWLQSQENASDQAVIGPLVAGMQSQVQAAGSATSGLSAELLGYTPADWNANHGLLDPARSSVLTAERAVYTAEREYYEALRYLNRRPTTTTTSTTTSTSAPSTSTTVPTSTTTSTEPGELASIQARAKAAVSARLSSLSTAITLVQSKSYLGSDGATLVANMQADESGLQALEAKIDADTTVAAALADYSDIFTGFRVYALVVPVVNDVIKVDYLDNVAVPALNQQISQLQAQVNSSNQAAINPLVSNMQAQVQTISSATSSLSAELLSYTATEWDANAQLLASANANIATSIKALRMAQSDYNRAIAYLRHGLAQPKANHKSNQDKAKRKDIDKPAKHVRQVLPRRRHPVPFRRDRH